MGQAGAEEPRRMRPHPEMGVGWAGCHDEEAGRAVARSGHRDR